MVTTADRIVAIKDANVVIDLVEAGLFKVWFSLGIHTITTDIVIKELSEGSQWEYVYPIIEEGLLGVEEFSSDEMMTSVDLSKSHGISVADASVLFLSQKLEAVLLTGDKRLRRSSEALGIEVHGVLWVIDILLERDVILKTQALAGLHLLLAAGTRLPTNEVERRMSAWSE